MSRTLQGSRLLLSSAASWVSCASVAQFNTFSSRYFLSFDYMSPTWYFWLFKQLTPSAKTHSTPVFFKAFTFGKVHNLHFIHDSDSKVDSTVVQCNSKNKVHWSHLPSLSWQWSWAVHHVLHYLLKPVKSCHLRVNPITPRVRSRWSQRLRPLHAGPFSNPMLLQNQAFSHLLQECWSLAFASSRKSLQKGKFQCLFCEK